MTHEQITRALVKLRPGADWSLNGALLSGIEWLDAVQTRPTDAEITSTVATLSVTPTLDEIYDQQILDSRLLRAVVLAINDGTLLVGGNKTPAQLKAIIKAKM
jgi:hypothetical protein